MSRPIVYCSGPLFCPEERAGMHRIAELLEGTGLETFLPQRDGLERFVLPLADSPVAAAPGSRVAGAALGAAVFALDVYQVVERCDALVINLNGRVPDEGAVAEAALAFAVGRPVVIYKEDDRAPFGGHDNSMVTCLASSGGPTRSADALPDAVQRGLGRARPTAVEHLAPDLRRAVLRGRRIWSLVSSIPPGQDLVAADLARRISELDS